MKTPWLVLAMLACAAGQGWLALAMESHWQQVNGAGPPLGRRPALVLRVLGAGALALSLAACLHADHPTKAALVWVLLLAVGALAVAFALAWRPLWLRPLALPARWAGARRAQNPSVARTPSTRSPPS